MAGLPQPELEHHTKHCDALNLKMLDIRINSTVIVTNENTYICISKNREETPEVGHTACHIASNIKTISQAPSANFAVFGLLMNFCCTVVTSGLKPDKILKGQLVKL